MLVEYLLVRTNGKSIIKELWRESRRLIFFTLLLDIVMYLYIVDDWDSSVSSLSFVASVQEIRTTTKESGRDRKSVKAFPGIHCLLRQLSKKHSWSTRRRWNSWSLLLVLPNSPIIQTLIWVSNLWTSHSNSTAHPQTTPLMVADWVTDQNLKLTFEILYPNWYVYCNLYFSIYFPYNSEFFSENTWPQPKAVMFRKWMNRHF